jgi:ribosomal protein S18 acetylase RimI-like enzyme
MSDEGPCRFLEWDSEHFGVRIARCERSPRDGGEMARVLAWCRERSIECLYALTSADDLVAVRLLEENAFRFVDVRMTYELSIERAGDRPTSSRRELTEPPIRFAHDADVPALRAIAAVSHADSRFYADGGFDRARCDELYATWIEKSCRGFADAVLVAEDAARVAGYLTCHARDSGRGEIGLVGVASSAHGRGLGRALVEAALRWFAERGIERASVVTQARNVAAQRLYQAAGFRTAAVELWHHRWSTGSGARA